MVSQNGIEAKLIPGGEEKPCCHHWMIEPPNGPVSRGVCRRCGYQRQFWNTPVELQSARDDTASVPELTGVL